MLTAEQIEARRNHIGGSDVPAIASMGWLTLSPLGIKADEE